MHKYHKINGIYKRHLEGPQKGKFIIGAYSEPEFEYLADNQWVGTEKIDGSNIRIHWDGERIHYGGRTDNAQIPVFLLEKLMEITSSWDLRGLFGPKDDQEFIPVTLFGEGYGNKIQKVGKHYIPDGVNFILFDVRIGDWWLERQAVDEIAGILGIQSVTVVFTGTLQEGIEFVTRGFTSTLAEVEAEGLIVVPAANLKNRAGNRIITKLKTKDFR